VQIEDLNQLFIDKFNDKELKQISEDPNYYIISDFARKELTIFTEDHKDFERQVQRMVAKSRESWSSRASCKC